MLGPLIFLFLTSLAIVGAVALYLGARYHDLAIKAFRKIARKMHLSSSQPIDTKWTKITCNQEEKLKSAVKITFSGDLILLRDMVERAYRHSSNDYDFSDMFRYIQPYLREADFNIGVFEGPMAGEERGFSSSNYDDGIRLFINFPDSFGRAVQDAGYGLVTLANNHLFDKGIEGQMRTLDILDSIGLDHIGSYRNQQEHDAIKIINLQGLKIAVLAYTYGCEFTTDSFFFNEDTAYRTDPVVRKKSKFFRINKQRVLKDFQRVKDLNPDLIIVLPHMGKQFRHLPDRDQKAWCKFFVDQGADIVFSCHSHAVQPIEWHKNSRGKNVLVAHCPGNFINSYIEHDGDASMIIQAYLDPKTGEPFAVGCMPIYCYCDYSNGSYTALPVFKATTAKSISCADYKRICEVQKIVTKTALGVEIPIHNLQEWYISFAQFGYVRNKVRPLEWKSDYHESKLVKWISHAKKVCFVGDSITDGMKNGGYGWYEPLMQMFPDIEVDSFALGAKTSTYFKANREQIAIKNADVYVIAFGCNDIRYRIPVTCAMDEKEYITNLEQLCYSIHAINPDAKLVFISPWESLEPDKYCKVNLEQKKLLYRTYTQALKKFAASIDALFINPNPFISRLLIDYPCNREFLFLDHIHPNADQGIRMFSEACIMSS